MSLLTAPIVENSDFLAGIYFIFLKNVLDPTWKSFNTEFEPQWNGRKSGYKVRQNLALFYNLVALILDQNCAKDCRVTKIVKETKFEEARGKLDTKNDLLRKTLVFMWNSALREIFNFYFSVVFCWYQQNFHFGGRLGIRL